MSHLTQLVKWGPVSAPYISSIQVFFLLLPATHHHPGRTELVSVYHWRAPLTPDCKFRYWNVSEMDLVSFQCQVSHLSASGSEFHWRTGFGQLAQHLDPNSLLNKSGLSQVLRLNTLLNTAHHKFQQRNTSHQSDQWEPLVSQQTPRWWLQALVFTDQNSDQALQVSYSSHSLSGHRSGALKLHVLLGSPTNKADKPYRGAPIPLSQTFHGNFSQSYLLIGHPESSKGTQQLSQQNF